MKIVNLINEKFGKLTVVKEIKGSRDGSKLWLCQCECGNTKQITTRHLNRKNNNIKSCGCLKNISGKEHRQWTGEGEISGDWWSTHVSREFKQRKRTPVSITVTLKEAWDLFLKQDKKCALTGIQLRFSKTGADNSASLDRIDSSMGYDIDNIQWVHKHVNFMKRNYSQEYFIDMCTKIAQKHGGVCPIK